MLAAGGNNSDYQPSAISPKMGHQVPLDGHQVKDLLQSLYTKLEEVILSKFGETKDRQGETHEVMINGLRELTGVKDTVLTQEGRFLELSQQLLMLQTALEAGNMSGRKEEHLYTEEADRTRRLKQELKALKTRYEELRLEHDATLKDLASAEARIRDAEKKERTYRIQIGHLQQIITKNATNANEVIDSVVIQKTCEIRAKIQSIVGRYCISAPGSGTRKVFPELKDLDDEWACEEENLSPDCSSDELDPFRQHWLRAKIFFIVDSRIFKERIFGVTEEQERALSQFEGDIAKRKQDRDTQVAEWRSLTIRCAKSLNVANHRRSQNTADYIVNFLRPWVVVRKRKGLSSVIATPENFEKDVLELCESAYALTLTLRQSTDTYQFESIPKDAKVNGIDNDGFVVQDIIGGPKEKLGLSKVRLTVFGVLTKTPQTGGPGESYVMEKAHVVCQAPRPLPSAGFEVQTVNSIPSEISK